MVDLYAPLVTGACTYFCDPTALLAKIQPGGSSQLIDTLREVKPTLFFAVPRVWEKLQSNIMQQQQLTRNVLKRAMVSWARTVGAQRCKRVQYESNYFGPPCGSALAQKFVLNPVKSALGLDKARALYSSAAPLSLETQKFFASFDMPIFEVYGQSECTGPHSASYHEMWKIGYSGRALPGTQSKIDPSSGELLIRGRHVFMGYLYCPELSKEAFDEEGYFRTGDTAEIDEDGFICITGRIKELLVTSGGENIPFLLLEDAIKAAMPAVSHCIVLGDRRKFPSALLTLKSRPGAGEKEGEQMLGKEALAVSDHIGSRAITVREAQEDTLWSIYINSGIRVANRKLASRAHHVRSWRLLPVDFSEDTGELTPTHKERRKVILDKYADVIESIYESAEHHS
jgi:long-chain-fatty-acid--CoA ligase ACSBG